MKKVKLSIGNKILGGFLVLIVLFTLNAVFSMITLNKSDTIIKENSKVIRPSMNAIQELNLLVTRSKMLITNWVYLQTNTEDKEALKELHSTEYPALKGKLKNLMQDWDDKAQVQMMDSIFITFESLLAVEKEIMSNLITFEDYDDPFLILEIKDTKIDQVVLPVSSRLISDLEEIGRIKKMETDEAEAGMIGSFNTLKTTIITLGLIVILVGFIGAFFLARSITKPLIYIKDIILKLGKGILPDNKTRHFNNDEIGEMASAVDTLVNGLKSTSHFAENIGNGKYDAEFTPLSEEDVLGNSLLDMRDNLKKIADEDKRRNWATEGLAKFGEILRNNNDHLAKLSDEIISNLVKYVKANQGGLFIKEDNEDESYLELAACYAWDKKKYIEQKIYKGEGLTGQSWLEKDTVYITDVPDNYVNITSGLGAANPSSILIVPLKVNEEIYGVIEIASFNTFSDFEVDFVEKIAESIASTISSVKINEKTQRLLEESTQMTEQMRSQEEEMRQNMEELQATQEEMERSQRDREDKELIVNSTNMLFELDDNYKIASTNDIAKQTLKYQENELVGTYLDVLVSSKDNLIHFKNQVLSGKPWSGILNLQNKKKENVVVKVSAGKVSDTNNGGSRILIFASDITHTNAGH